MPLVKHAGLAILMSLTAASAIARDAEFPAADDPASVAAWLGAHTNIKPASVVTLTPGFVVAVVARQKPLAPNGPVRVTLREEVIAPAFVESVGGRSSLISLQIQCEERRLRMDGRHLYAGPNLSGTETVGEPSTDWLRIPEDTVMDDVANAVCGDNYVSPLQAYAQAAPVVAAQAPQPEPKAEQPARPLAPAPRYAVQIGAYQNQQLAETAWKALAAERPVLTRGHDFDVRPVRVKGRDLLRGLVLNFNSPEESAAFCEALAETGYGCILRTLPK